MSQKAANNSSQKQSMVNELPETRGSALDLVYSYESFGHGLKGRMILKCVKKAISYKCLI